MKKTFILVLGLFSTFFITPATADSVNILAAEFKNTSTNQWTVNVTLKHEDAGWEHYADNWRVVDHEGKILGDRVLYHPHVNEQPFTRSLSNVSIPKDITKVYIEAHDKVHGWTPDRLMIDLSTASKGHLLVRSK